MSVVPAGRRHGGRRRVRVVVVDDHPVFRGGVIELLGTEADLDICGEAGTVADALRLVAERLPQVAIVDLSLGGESGIDLVSALTARHPDVRVLVISGYDERLHAERALSAGALGYIMKDRTGLELLVAVRAVAAGRSYVSAVVAEQVLATLGSRRRAERSPLGRLSNRERQVLELVGRGLTTREIAAQLRLSIKTIETHYAHLKEKLGARHARDLTRMAVTLTGS